jgi:hypothetical protein
VDDAKAGQRIASVKTRKSCVLYSAVEDTETVRRSDICGLSLQKN